MPGIIDPETINVMAIPGIWSPVQWELTEEERINELEAQTVAGLLWSVDIPEAILRLLLQEAEITRIFEPPENYDPEIQGEWNPEITANGFRNPIELVKVERETNYLYLEYKLGDSAYWYIEIEPEKVTIARF
ncbi:MAG: hypothetical protein C3F13_05500 [Anaerolineales bacterium]|nr:hypothetical protein [Anaerolineae bacterium]PWB54906.1 MAG: hypothetical protein C3F13_05500 [Anaerolineales bacterium]